MSEVSMRRVVRTGMIWSSLDELVLGAGGSM